MNATAAFTKTGFGSGGGSMLKRKMLENEKPNDRR